MDQKKQQQHLLHNADRGPCRLCASPGRACARCRLDYYCNQQHQRLDWQRHSRGCGALELRKNTTLGRHLVATKDIPAGTVIIRELPLLTMPYVEEEQGVMVCVSCCAILPRGPDGKLPTWPQCQGCGWPVCKPCQLHPSKSSPHRAECEAFQRAKFRVCKVNDDVLDLAKRLKEVDIEWIRRLSALRTCLAAKQQPRIWSLQSAIATFPRDFTPAQMGLYLSNQVCFPLLLNSNYHQKDAVWLRTRARLSWLKEDDLKRAAAINYLNNFAEAPDGLDTPRWMSSLFAGMSMLEHSCMPNTWAIRVNEETAENILITSRDIKKGEHLSIDYQDNPIRGKPERSLDCAERGFICCCELCKDPTEKDLFLGSPRCRHCKNESSFVIREICSHCKRQQSPGDIEADSTKEEFYELLQKHSGEPRPEVWEKFIRKHLWPRGLLHPTHYIILRAKLQIVKAVEQNGLTQPGIGEKRDDDEVDRWEATARHLLWVLSVLRPGLNPHRRNVLTFLFNILVLNATQALRLGGSVKLYMEEARSLLKELEPMMITETDKDYYCCLNDRFNGVTLLINSKKPRR